MLKLGDYNDLKAVRDSEHGVYLEADGKEILLPNRFVPRTIKEGDVLRVFVYHDNEGRLTATTQKPLGVVGDILKLKVYQTTHDGAFLDWGLMRHLFVPPSAMVRPMQEGREYLVRICIDELTQRLFATEKIDRTLSNEELSVEEKQEVDLIVLRRSEAGYVVAVNGKHQGLIHTNETFRPLKEGEKLKGFVGRIREHNKLDILPGRPGFKKTDAESLKLIEALQQAGGFLPLNDKTPAEEIYRRLGISKKTFKMTVGTLFKQKKIRLREDGIELLK